MSTTEEKISALVKRRAGLKAYITICMKNLNALDVDDLKIHFQAHKGTILNYLQKVQKVDESIIEVYDQGDESMEEGKLTEITSQIGYNDSIRDELTLIERRIDISLTANSNPPLQPPMAVKIPKLECKIFDGTSKDKLEFNNFLTQFSNCIDACGTLSNANKLTLSVPALFLAKCKIFFKKIYC